MKIAYFAEILQQVFGKNLLQSAWLQSLHYIIIQRILGNVEEGNVMVERTKADFFNRIVSLVKLTVLNRISAR